jgi:TonB family protein
MRILIIAIAALFSFLNCKTDSIRVELTENVDTTCVSRREWALYKFRSGEFSFPVTREYRRPYYFEEAFFILYKVKGNIFDGAPCIVMNKEEPDCYDTTLDSLICSRFGKDAFDRAEKTADSIYNVDPKRYSSDVLYYPSYIPNGDSLYSDLRKVMRYPASAKRDSISGVVYVRLEIDSLGSVRKATVVKGVRNDLDSAAIAGAMQLGKFRTEIRWGIRHGGMLTIPIKFSLK